MSISTKNILVVDDSKNIREAVIDMLKAMGAQNIFEAESGNVAWSDLESKKNEGLTFDLILSDWNMPIMTGIELLQKVRTSPLFSKVPFIIMTTESEKSKILDAVALGVTNYMIKPMEKSEFETKINSAIQ